LIKIGLADYPTLTHSHSVDFTRNVDDGIVASKYLNHLMQLSVLDGHVLIPFLIFLYMGMSAAGDSIEWSIRRREANHVL